MSDFADVASDITEHQIAVALANHQAKQPTTRSTECQDCGVTIPAARLALINTTRCVDCQTLVEAKNRLIRGVSHDA